MKRLFLTAAIAAALLTTAIAQEAPPKPAAAPPDPVTLTLTRATVQSIGQGLMKLPFETAAPILNDLQAQLNAADTKAIKATVDKEKADSPAEAPKPDSPGTPRVKPPK